MISSTINIFGKNIPLYGICFFLGILIAVMTATFIAPKRKLPRYEIIYSAVYIMVGALIGSKLLFIAVTMEMIIKENIPIEAVLRGGFVFYGGLAGGAAGLIIYAKQFKMSVDTFCEIYAAVLPLGHAIGRIGCFFAGCCYGIPYDGLLSCTYQHAIGNTPCDMPLLPIQLIEATALIMVFVFLIIVFFHTQAKWAVTSTYMILYSVIRFTLEFFRGDKERGYVLSLSVSQWVSILMLSAAILLLARIHSSLKKRQS